MKTASEELVSSVPSLLFPVLHSETASIQTDFSQMALLSWPRHCPVPGPHSPSGDFFVLRDPFHMDSGLGMLNIFPEIPLCRLFSARQDSLNVPF